MRLPPTEMTHNLPASTTSASPPRRTHRSVSALAMIGEVHRARALFEKLLSFAGPLLLYAEEIDAHTGYHLGNFPQAFTHLSLIDAAGRLLVHEPHD